MLSSAIACVCCYKTPSQTHQTLPHLVKYTPYHQICLPQPSPDPTPPFKLSVNNAPSLKYSHSPALRPLPSPPSLTPPPLPHQAEPPTPPLEAQSSVPRPLDIPIAPPLLLHHHLPPFPHRHPLHRRRHHHPQHPQHNQTSSAH